MSEVTRAYSELGNLLYKGLTNIGEYPLRKAAIEQQGAELGLRGAELMHKIEGEKPRREMEKIAAGQAREAQEQRLATLNSVFSPATLLQNHSLDVIPDTGAKLVRGFESALKSVNPDITYDPKEAVYRFGDGKAVTIRDMMKIQHHITPIIMGSSRLESTLRSFVEAADIPGSGVQDIKATEKARGLLADPVALYGREYQNLMSVYSYLGPTMTPENREAFKANIELVKSDLESATKVRAATVKYAREVELEREKYGFKTEEKEEARKQAINLENYKSLLRSWEKRGEQKVKAGLDAMKATVEYMAATGPKRQEMVKETIAKIWEEHAKDDPRPVFEEAGKEKPKEPREVTYEEAKENSINSLRQLQGEGVKIDLANVEKGVAFKFSHLSKEQQGRLAKEIYEAVNPQKPKEEKKAAKPATGLAAKREEPVELSMKELKTVINSVTGRKPLTKSPKDIFEEQRMKSEAFKEKIVTGVSRGLAKLEEWEEGKIEKALLDTGQGRTKYERNEMAKELRLMFPWASDEDIAKAVRKLHEGKK